MTEVFFTGRGAWFIEDNGQSRLVIDHRLDKDNSTHPDFMFCAKYTGVFKLVDEDEKSYKDIKNFELIKKSVRKLLPCSHPVSAFSKMVKDGLLSEEDAQHCYFLIQANEWRKRKFIEVPFELDVVNTGEPTKAETITETERNTMLKLIIGMAMDSYEYNPNSTRNSATGDKNGISAKLQLHGISVNDDTVRKYLTEAKKLLSRQEE